MNKLPHYYSPLFYRFPNALRFEIGPDDLPIGTLYFEEAEKRAKEIFRFLFSSTTSLDFHMQIITYEGQKKLPFIGLQRLLLKKVAPESVRYASYQNPYDDEGMLHQFTLTIQPNQLKWAPLLTAIIHQDFGRFRYQQADFYFERVSDQVCYHLYDDRGLDIIAPKASDLKEVYTQFFPYLLPDDLEKMNQLMRK